MEQKRKPTNKPTQSVNLWKRSKEYTLGKTKSLFSKWCWESWTVRFNSVQSLSHVRFFATPWITSRQASLSITNSWISPKLMYIDLVMPSSHLILCHPLLLLPPIPPKSRVFSYESTLRMRWPKYWSLRLNISPSKEIPGLVSFGMDWLDLLAVQGTLKSLLQHHSSKASILPMQEIQEMWNRSLGWEDALEKGMTTHSGILSWRIPWTEEPGGL